jgi:putative ABC transport system permease protein
MFHRLSTLLLVNSKLCFIEILSNKMRSVISSFGIFIGVATLLTLLSFIRAMNKEVKENIVKMGGLDIISIKKLEPDDKEEEIAFRGSPGLRIDQARDLKRTIPEIVDVLPLVSDHRHFRTGSRHSGGRLNAVSLNHFDIYNYELGSGRKFTQEDFNVAARVCIIGNRIAERVFPDVESPLGRSITTEDNVTFKVIGTIYTEERWDRRSRELLYPFPTYQAYLGGASGKLSEINIRVNDLTRLKQTKEQIRAQLLTMHRGVEDFDVVLNEEKIREMENTSRALNILLAVLSILSLLTGGVSIMNIMFATIGDRIREIGLRKALGAHRSDLFVQFLIEAVLLCLVGGILGMAMGSATSIMPRELLPMDPHLLNSDYLLALGFIILVGIFAGMFPALRAANMRPIEALQYG